MAKVRLAELVKIDKTVWSPTVEESTFVNHYSIPNFDLGAPRSEATSSIKSNKFLLTGPCILMSKLNPIQPRVWLIEELPPGINVCSTEFVVLKATDRARARDAYFQLKSPAVASRLVELATGTSNSHQRVRPSEILAVEVEWLEDVKPRKSASDFLWSLERKINLNNAIAMKLEAIAQTVFKSWFVDFDPVHAKARGEQPVGMNAETAALFPESIEDSERGLIPTGWAWGVLSQLAEVIDCLHSKKPNFVKDGYPYLQLNTVSDNGILHFDKAAMISEVDYKKWTSRIEVSEGDCVITNVGRVGAVSQIPRGIRAAIGRNMTAVRPIEPHETKTFLISLLTSQFMKSEISLNTDSGTILDALNVRSIPNLRSPIPSADVLLAFEAMVGPFWAKMNNLYRENVTLGNIRDALLPRIVSGELELPEELLS